MSLIWNLYTKALWWFGRRRVRIQGLDFKGGSMPVAVVHEEPEHFDLKTCPPDGYVKIKRLDYGEKLARRKFMSKMEMEGSKGKSVKTTFDIFNESAELYDMAHAVVEHNLTDKDGRPLVFTNPDDVRKIAGIIAEEIGTYIDKVNNFEEDEELGNSSGASAPTLS
jgi:hypothetical protein